MYLADDLGAEDNGRDCHNSATRADLAEMIGDLADELVNLYEAEQDARQQGENAPPS
jgi:hypothetical protein